MYNDRRRFLHRTAPLLGLTLLGFRPLIALAQSRPRLDPEAPQARAMNYVEHAETAQGASAYREGRHCGNCDIFSASNDGCGLFPDHRVVETGWCSAWTAKG